MLLEAKEETYKDKTLKKRQDKTCTDKENAA